MPELPEVETVRRGLEQTIKPQQKIVELRFLSQKLRDDLPFDKISLVEQRSIQKIIRRAKYLLIQLDQGTLLSHLGMTGSWRYATQRHENLSSDPRRRNHDHIEIILDDGRILVFRDPRRFGQFDILPDDAFADKRLKDLGPEPLDGDQFHAEYFWQVSRGRHTPIKTFIMHQKIVVGVGNIYASEALFLAGINPLLKAGSLTQKQAEKLVTAIREVLEDAIEFGGTTISDFRQAGGSEGYFQNILLVYGEEGQPCAACDSKIRSRVLAGRSTYWCPKCQSL